MASVADPTIIITASISSNPASHSHSSSRLLEQETIYEIWEEAAPPELHSPHTLHCTAPSPKVPFLWGIWTTLNTVLGYASNPPLQTASRSSQPFFSGIHSRYQLTDRPTGRSRNSTGKNRPLALYVRREIKIFSSLNLCPVRGNSATLCVGAALVSQFEHLHELLVGPAL